MARHAVSISVAVPVSFVIAVEVAIRIGPIAVVHGRAENAGLSILVLARLAELLAAAETLAALEAATAVALRLRCLLRMLNRLTLLRLAGLSGLCTWTSASTTPPTASASSGLLLGLPGRMV